MVGRLTRRHLLIATIVFTPSIACDAFSDPAVRLARCLEGAINDAVPSTAMIEATCDLRLQGNFLVVLHPSGELTDEQLIAAGLPQAAIPELRALRIGDHASIYVIATEADAKGTGDRSTPSSRTTYQNNFVKIDHLFVRPKTSQPVVVEVGGPAGARVVQTIH